MEEWKEYKIGDVCRIKHGFAFKGIYFVDNQQKYVCVTPGNFALKGGFKNDKPKYYNGPIPEDYVLQKDDLVVTMTDLSKNGDTLGYSALIPYDEHYTFLHNQRIGLIEDISNEIDKHFLYWVMRTYDYQRYIVGHCSGSTVKHTSPSGIGSYIFRCPDMETQREISSILDNLDDKIEVNRKINENLEQQAQALFKSWFVDFEPFKNGEFVESELRMIPKGWRVGSIYDYIDVVYGAPYKSSLFNDKKEGLPLIRIRDLKTNAPQFYTPEILPNTEFVKAGDIVAGMDAEFIPYVWLGEKGVLNQRCCKFMGKNEAISNYYILFLIKPELEYVQSYKTGTTVSHLGKSDIDRFRFVTPPLDVVKSFSDLVDGMLKELVNRANESRRLAELRDTLLPKLMSGELKVNEIA